MRRTSHRTIVNRIKRGENICPICGCRLRIRNDHGVAYPERWIDEHCAQCGQFVCYSDNSPYIEICDLIRESKHISYKQCVKAAKKFGEHY